MSSPEKDNATLARELRALRHSLQQEQQRNAVLIETNNNLVQVNEELSASLGNLQISQNENDNQSVLSES